MLCNNFSDDDERDADSDCPEAKTRVTATMCSLSAPTSEVDSCSQAERDCSSKEAPKQKGAPLADTSGVAVADLSRSTCADYSDDESNLSSDLPRLSSDGANCSPASSSPSMQCSADPSKRAPANLIEMRFLIRRREAGALIGKRGSNIKRLREEFKSSTFNVPDTGNGPERVVCIVTDSNSAEPILRDVTELLLEKSPEHDEQIEIKLLIHSSHAGSLIGIGGQSIKKLRNDSKAAIKIYEMCCPLSSERVCAIKAKPPVVASTIRLVQAILAEHPIKGTIKPYDALNFDLSLVDKYGGYLADNCTMPPSCWDAQVAAAVGQQLQSAPPQRYQPREPSHNRNNYARQPTYLTTVGQPTWPNSGELCGQRQELRQRVFAAAAAAAAAASTNHPQRFHPYSQLAAANKSLIYQQLKSNEEFSARRQLSSLLAQGAGRSNATMARQQAVGASCNGTVAGLQQTNSPLALQQAIRQNEQLLLRCQNAHSTDTCLCMLLPFMPTSQDKLVQAAAVAAAASAAAAAADSSAPPNRAGPELSAIASQAQGCGSFAILRNKKR